MRLDQRPDLAKQPRSLTPSHSFASNGWPLAAAELVIRRSLPEFPPRALPQGGIQYVEPPEVFCAFPGPARKTAGLHAAHDDGTDILALHQPPGGQRLLSQRRSPEDAPRMPRDERAQLARCDVMRVGPPLYAAVLFPRARQPPGEGAERGRDERHRVERVAGLAGDALKQEPGCLTQVNAANLRRLSHFARRTPTLSSWLKWA